MRKGKSPGRGGLCRVPRLSSEHVEFTQLVVILGWRGRIPPGRRSPLHDSRDPVAPNGHAGHIPRSRSMAGLRYVQCGLGPMAANFKGGKN